MASSNSLVLAEVLSVRNPTVYYLACKKCYSKVVLDDTDYVCLKCAKKVEVSETQQRYRLSLNITDGSVNCSVTVFGKQLDPFMGCSADEFNRYCNSNREHATCYLEECLNKVVCGKWFIFGFKKIARACNKSSVSLRDIIKEQSDSSQIVAWQMTVCETKSDVRSTVIDYLRQPSNVSVLKNSSYLECESTSFSFEQISVSSLHSSVVNRKICTSGIDLTLCQDVSVKDHTDLCIAPDLPMTLTKTSIIHTSKNQLNSNMSDSVECIRAETTYSQNSIHVSTVDCDETYDPVMQISASSTYTSMLTSPHRTSLVVYLPQEAVMFDENWSIMHDKELTFDSVVQTFKKRRLSVGENAMEVTNLCVSPEDSILDESLLLLAGSGLSKQFQKSYTRSFSNTSSQLENNLLINNRSERPIPGKLQIVSKSAHVPTTELLKDSEIMDEMPYSEDLEAFLLDIDASENWSKSGFHVNTEPSESCKCDTQPMQECKVLEVSRCNQIENVTQTLSASALKCDMLEEMPDSEDLHAFLQEINSSFTETAAAKNTLRKDILESFVATSLKDELKESDIEIDTDERNRSNYDNNKFEMVKNCTAKTKVTSSKQSSDSSQIMEEMPYSEDLEAFLADMNEASHLEDFTTLVQSNDTASKCDSRSKKSFSNTKPISVKLQSNSLSPKEAASEKKVLKTHCSSSALKIKEMDRANVSLPCVIESVISKLKEGNLKSESLKTNCSSVEGFVKKVANDHISQTESHTSDCDILFTEKSRDHKYDQVISSSLLANSLSEDLFTDGSFNLNDSEIIPITPGVKKPRLGTNSGLGMTASIRQDNVCEKQRKETSQKTVLTKNINGLHLTWGNTQIKQRKSVNFAMHLLEKKTIPKIDVQMLFTPSPLVSCHTKMKSCLKRDKKMIPELKVQNNTNSEQLFTPSPLVLSFKSQATLYQSTPNLFDSSDSMCEQSGVSENKDDIRLYLTEVDQNMSSQLFTDESAFDVSSSSTQFHENLSLRNQMVNVKQTVDKPSQYVLSEVTNSCGVLNSTKYWDKHCDSNISEDLFSDEDSFEQTENICVKLFPE